METTDNTIKHPSLGEGLGRPDLEKWYSHLTVESKERAMGIPYPRCTQLWNALDTEKKAIIYTAMGGRDAHDHHKWKKNNPSLT